MYLWVYTSQCVMLQHQTRHEVKVWSNQGWSRWNVTSYISDVKRVPLTGWVSFRMSSYWILQPMIYILCQNSVPIQRIECPLLARRRWVIDVCSVMTFTPENRVRLPSQTWTINVGFYKRSSSLSHPSLYNFAKINIVWWYRLQSVALL